ncbi:DUF2782 domain-containing protein [Dokdonella sp.]|uniref:DUF2782 domain-containing protein n=1 Tax=Dokdonella sp. TaxID=2291710 RepID=UPI00352700E2
MKRTLILLALLPSIAATGIAWSDEDTATPPAQETFGSAPPPPGMNDPGVVSKPAPTSSAATAASSDSDSLKPAMPDTSPVRSQAARKPTPEQIIATSDSVSERKQGTDTVKEYRKNGILRMVHIIPENGPEQMYRDENGDGRLDRDALDGPVSPVYFSLYQWD